MSGLEPVVTTSEDETCALGRTLAASLAAGDVVLIHGELGAGKTAFVRGLAEGLGANPDEVSSPTFTLIQEYRGGRAALYHVDLYRLEPAEVEDLGLDELPGPDGVVAIEWPERWAQPPSDAIEVRIEHAGEERRLITVKRLQAERTSG